MKRIAWVVGVCVALMVPAVAAEPEEKVLVAGPLKSVGLGAPYLPLMKPFKPWKIDWDGYIYRDFYPCVSDHHVAARPADDRPPEKVVHFNEGTMGAPLQARCMLFLQFGAYPGGKVPRNHPDKTCETFDWTGFDLLRMDAKAAGSVHVWWTVEDMDVEPPVAGNFDPKPGAWVTLEIDLARAARERGLNLARMWRMAIYANTVPGEEVELRNIRLARRDARSPYPVVSDPGAADVPRPAKQAAPKPDIERDVRPLGGARTLVYSARTPLLLRSQNLPTGFVAAYDAQNVLLLLADTTFQWYTDKGAAVPRKGNERDEMFAVQTLDGGKTWQGLDADKERTWLHVTVRPTGRVIDDLGGAVLWSKDGCGNNPGPRHRIQKFSFLGTKGWTVNRKDYVFNSENYHCGITRDNAVRLPDGRIWAAFCIAHRLIDPGYGVHVKYSDDDGRNWIPWNEGHLAWLPGSRPTWGGGTWVAPCGDKVGVVWYSQADDQKHYWALFDGKAWSKPEAIYGKYLHSVVSVNGKTPLLAGGPIWGVELGGVKSFDGSKWVRELTLEGDETALCVCGGRVAAVVLNGKRDAFMVYWRSPEGKWTEKPEVFQTGPVSEWMAPAFGAPNLAPVVYIPADKATEARVLLAPARQ